MARSRGQQFVDAERLGDIVVGAGIERRNLAGIAVTGRQDDDRYRCPAAQPTDHVDTVEARQTEIQEHEIRRDGCCLDQRLLAGGSERHVVAVGTKVDVERSADLYLVVDDQDAGHDSASSATCSRIVIVSPPPGVSSRLKRAPIASMNPLAMARPSPTPASFERSPSR